VSKPAVFLDRDGVLNIPLFSNGRSYAPKRLEDFILYGDAATSVDRLKTNGFLVVVVTNQPDVGAGKIDKKIVDEMHKRLRAEVSVDEIEVCYETKEEATDRRKPGAAMLLEATAKLGIDLNHSYMVGDRSSDVEAARQAGVIPIFIDHGYSEPRPPAPTQTAASLGQATDWILNQGTKTDSYKICDRK